LSQAPSDQVDAEKPQRISTPFPDGESYEQTTKRMGEFLDEVKLKLDGATIMIIGHRATQYGLEYWINHRSLESIITAPWKWQPGWEYTL
jgi:broad specificity phosphatase PhoE